MGVRERLLRAVESDYEWVWRVQQACGVQKDGGRGYAVLHAVFTVGAAMGNELFYIVFLPFVFWSGLPMVGRRMMVVWGVSGYVGQLAKDILRLPRPGPPAVRLEHHYATEYGLPSTHAMFAFSLPITIAHVTATRAPHAPLTPPVLWAIAAVWAAAKTLSRLYMGVHSRPDIVAGIALGLAFSALFLLSPLGDAIDAYIVSRAAPTLSALPATLPALASPAHPAWGILLFVTAAVAAVPYLNGYSEWTSTYADTVTIAGACNGALMGAAVFNGDADAPAALAYSAPVVFGRALLGFALLALVRAAVKATVFPLVAAVAARIGTRPRLGCPSRAQSYAVDIPTRLVTYSAVGFAAVVVVPLVFSALGLSHR